MCSPAVRGRTFFSEFKTKNEGFGHQEAAWRRLRSDGDPGNTLVVTGTLTKQRADVQKDIEAVVILNLRRCSG